LKTRSGIPVYVKLAHC